MTVGRLREYLESIPDYYEVVINVVEDEEGGLEGKGSLSFVPPAAASEMVN